MSIRKYKVKPVISTLAKLKLRNKVLLDELAEIQETLRAIQNGEVDALVVNGKQGEQILTLKSADQPYRVLVDHMNEGAVTLSSDGSIFYCNRRFSEYMEAPLDVLIGTSVFSFLKSDEIDRFKALFTLGRLSKNCSDDFYFSLKLDKVIPLRITMSSTRIDDKHGVCMIATDLTQQIRQKEYEKLTIELKGAIQARDEFITIASHELKTPLTSMILLAQLQKKMFAKNDPRAFEENRFINFAEKTESFASKLNILVEAMLDITKIHNGKISLTKEKIDLGELTQSVLTRMSTMFAAAGCEQPILKSSVIFGNWDSKRLEQVLNNLLVNAIKYGNHSPIEVGISSKKGVARFTVKDKGDGVLKSDQFKIFGLYERAISASEISGLGLGLYISQKIVEAHGGIIWIDSVKGQGATFIFEIPTGLG